jgi:hypothetical protein
MASPIIEMVHKPCDGPEAGDRVRHAWNVGLPAATLCAVLLFAASTKSRGAEQTQRPPDPTEEIQRAEGEAILELAELTLAGKPVPSDFRVQWQNVFLKAQRGTFVPFTLTVDASRLSRPSALVYARAVRRDATAQAREGRPSSKNAVRRSVEDDPHPVDVVFPVELKPEPGQLARVSRGFALAPGDYDVHVVVRERVDPSAPQSHPRAAVLTERLQVPDFWSGELTTSSIILADQVSVLSAPLGPDELVERPYVIGQHEITPAADRQFRRDEELIVVFLIYNPFVTSDKQFDVQVEYHFFRKGGQRRSQSAGADVADRPAERDGEQYFNHTDPQRFNPASLGPHVNPAAGQPVMAGQGIPLAEFDAGDYRLAVKVTDRVARQSILRDVYFRVGP